MATDQLNNMVITPQDPGGDNKVSTDKGKQQTDTINQAEFKNLTSFPTCRVRLKRIIDDWKRELAETEKRRRTRDVDVNIESMRRDGTLDEDETLIPVRVIETNIQRELPAYINYVKNSRRIMIFDCLSIPNKNSDLIEQEFTRGMTYIAWETAHYKVVDGAATHAWDAVEVVLDASKPLKVALEQVGHDKLFFPLSTLDIQAAPMIIRAYDVSAIELKKFIADFDFDANQCNLILTMIQGNRKENESFRIYKTMFKFDDIVYVAWFSLEYGTSDWLKAPMKLSLGIKRQDIVAGPNGQPTTDWVNSDISMYPYFLLPYRETEKPRIIEKKGRVFLDENKQEGQTAIMSGFVNALNRAIQIHASPKTDDGTGNSVKEIANEKIEGGKIFTKPVDFWSLPYPDPEVIRAMQYLDTANANETNSPNFAVMNREDSRKTAKEIEAGQQQTSLLNSVQLTLFSTYIRSVYSFVWAIVQSLALQDKIDFLLIPKQKPQLGIDNQPIIDPQAQQPVMETYYENDFDTIKQKYDLRAAGDIDVVQRQEMINQMSQDWNVIQGTPLAGRFLQDLIRLKYPSTGDAYAAILAQGNPLAQMQGLVKGLDTVLQTMIKNHPEIVKMLKPQEQQQLEQLLQAANQAVQPQPANQPSSKPVTTPPQQAQ